MRYVPWARNRTGRLLVILIAVVSYFLLLVMDGLRFFPLATGSPFLNWMRFGFSALIALMFLAVGALVWLYARDRRVALILFCSSFTMMVVFAIETATAVTNDGQLLAVTGASGSLTLLLFSILLLVFPNNYVAWFKRPGVVTESIPQSRSRHYILLLYWYIAVLGLLCIITVLYSFLRDSLSLQLPDWLNTIVNGYYSLALIGILTTIIISYRQASSLRTRQQIRLFVVGVILAFAPFLFLTVLPTLFNLPSQFVVEGQISTLTAALLPLALGYSILRYQVLIFDRYIRRAAAWMAGAVALAVLGYLVVMLSSLFLSGNTVAYIISVALALLVLGPCVWWLAHTVTERLFFSEIVHYRRLVDAPDLLTRETFDLNEASELLTLAAVNAFETQEVCLFVLDEDTGYYRLSPPLKQDDPADMPRRHLVKRLLRVVKSPADENNLSDRRASLPQQSDWLDAQVPLVKHVDLAKRPLLLSEAIGTDADLPTGLARYLAIAPSEKADPLLAPVRAQDKMIGVLVLGERGDQGQYAGPDFEVIDLIIARFSPVLETARLYEHSSRHVAALNTLYSASAMLEKAYQSIEEVAITYAAVAAEAAMAGAEIWLFDEVNTSLRRVIHLGSGPGLISSGNLLSLQESDRSAWFYEGHSAQSREGLSAGIPACLPQTPYFPLAWIPLIKGVKYYGILVLTYPRPHIFSQEEKRVLGMFANQCAAAMENAQITIALRAAYERQKELDRLKDQFIMTASHELRTPLTAVQGYIELLSQYNNSLSTEQRAEFIAKANRGCDELVLMVGNIMDAGRVDIEVERIRLYPVSLRGSVVHILEILDSIVRRENRQVQMDVPSNILVMADDLPLRQVLLNLMSNAFKYSPVGSRINISARVQYREAMLRVRDYGQGVLANDQERLFERFVRLERDMNSPVRGAGLGLYISKRLVQAMGGRIWVESSGQPGEGSVFAFTLKCQKDE